MDSCSRHNGCKLESSPDLLFLLGFVIPAQIYSDDLLFLHKSVIHSSHQLVSSGQTQRRAGGRSKAGSSSHLFPSFLQLSNTAWSLLWLDIGTPLSWLHQQCIVSTIALVSSGQSKRWAGGRSKAGSSLQFLRLYNIPLSFQLSAFKESNST